MKKWLIRILAALICFTLLLVGGFWGIQSFYRWKASKDRETRSLAVRSFFPSKARVIVYSLEPVRQPSNDPNTFHGYPIRGSAEITAWDEKAALILSLSKGIADSRFSSMCFDPHHGLRIIDDSRKIDFVICFLCQQIEPFNFNDNKMFGTTGYPFAVFDLILKRHGLPVFKRE